MSRLGLGLGIIKGGGIRGLPFNPLSYDPSIYFNADNSMLSAMQNPTLDLDPSVPSSLDIITATRAGTATVTDASGNIVDAAPNTVRVDHLQGELITAARTNLLPYSEDFSNPAWAKILTAVMANDSLSPDGSITADRMTIPSAANFQGARLTGGVSVSSGTDITISFYAKADGTINPLVLFSNGSVFSRVLFNLSSGTSSHYDGSLAISHSIEEAAHGFYRCHATFQSAGDASISIRNASAGDGTSSILLWGAQLEAGNIATSYIPTAGAPITVPAVYGPRVPMILCEPAATNLVPTKEFIISGTATIASGFLAPDGSMDAYEASNILDAAGDRVNCGSVTVSGSTEYTGSIYVKGTAGEVASFYAKRSSGATYAGTENLHVTLTGSWQRVTGLTFTTAADSTQARVFVRTDIGTTTANTIQVWGAQLELGPISTSVIKTTAGAVTRASDIYKIVGTDFTDLWNTSEGTFYSDYIPRTSATRYFLLIGDSYTSRVFYSNAGSLILGGYDGVNSITVGTTTLNETNRVCLTFNPTTGQGALDGASVYGVKPHSGNLGSTSLLNIGSNVIGTEQLNGHIKRLIYWPAHSSRLSSDFLTQVTGISTSGDVLAEIELKADNLDLVPVLRNLGQGASNATQDIALNQPVAHVPVNGGHLYLPAVAGNSAKVASLGYGYSDPHTYRVDFNCTTLDVGYIFGTRDASVGALSVYQLSSGGFTVYKGSTGLTSAPSGSISVGVDYSLVLSYDGAGGVVIYLNGVSVGSGTTDSTGWDTTTDLLLGGRGDGAGSSIYSFNGTITRASVYASALTPAGLSAASPVLDIDFSKAPHAATSFTPTVGGTVTINQSGNDPATIVRRPFLRFDGVNSKMSGLFNTTITSGTFFMVARGRVGTTSGYYFYTSKSGESNVVWRYTNINGTLRSYYQGANRLNHAATNSGIGHLVSHIKLTDVGEASLNGEFLTDATNPAVNSEIYEISRSGVMIAADIEHMSFFPESSRINTRTNTRAMLTYLEGKYPATTVVEPPLNPTFELIPTGESIVAIKTRSLVQGSDGKLYGAPYYVNFNKLLRIDPVTGAVDYDTPTSPQFANDGSKWIAGFKLNDGRTFHNAHGATAGNLIVDVSTGSPVLSTMGQGAGQHRGGLQSSSDQLIYQSAYTAAKGFSKLNPATGQYLTSAVYAVNTDGPLYTSNLALAESSQHYRQWGLCEDPVSKFIFGTPVGGDRIVYHDVINNVTEQGADLLTGNVPAPTSTSDDYFMKYTGDGIYSPISQRIYCFPRRANAILVINPADKSAIEIPTPDELYDPVLQKSFAAVMGGDGCIYSVPWGVPYLFRIDPRNHEIRTWNIQDIFTAAGGQLGVGWWTAGMAVGNEIWYAPGGAHDVLKVSLNYGFDSGFGAGFK